VKETDSVTSDDSAEEPRPGRAPRSASLVLLGVAALAATGVAFAHFALPRLNDDPGPPPDDNQVSIVMGPVKPPPVPQSSGPMDVLAPGMAEAAAPPPPVVSDEPPPADGAETAQPAPVEAGPSFDCAAHLTRGQAAVCADPGLAALDRRMARAYGEAMAAGAPMDDLRADQADWRAAREDAAERSPAAIAQVYNERIGELTDLADYLRRR
jgi:uncharacterized protein YecT (DUF1311 family)